MINRISLLPNRLDHHMREVIQGASTTFVLRMLGLGLGFGFNVLVARMLGADDAGIYFLAFTVINIAATAGRVGLDNAVLRFTAANQAIDNWRAVKGVYQKGMSFALAATLVTTILVFLLSPWLGTIVFKKPDVTAPLRWMTLAIIPMALAALHSAMLKGLKRIRDAELIQSVIIRGLSVIGLLMVGVAWGVVGVVWAYVLAVGLTAVAGYLLWRVATPQLRGITGQFDIHALLQSSMPLFWMTLIELIMGRFSIFILGIYGTSADVGVFGAAFRVAMMTSFVLVAVNSIAAPKFAALYQLGDRRALESTAQNATRLIVLLATPVLLLIIFSSRLILGVFGSEFVVGGSALVILCLGQFVNVVTGPVGYLLMMSGNERVRRNVVLASAVVSAVLNIVLVRRYGIVGAAVATAVGWAIQNIATAYYAFRVLNIRVFAIFYP